MARQGAISTPAAQAIAPRFDEVSDFVEAGLAIVTLDGKRQIIDRQGKPTGDALDASVDNAQLSDGLPARLIVRYRPEYQAPDGTRRYDEPGRRITGAYGKDLLIAATERGEYGLLNDKWNGWSNRATRKSRSSPTGRWPSPRAARKSCCWTPRARP